MHSKFSATPGFVVVLLMSVVAFAHGQQTGDKLPTFDLPDPKIAEVYRGNWENTLKLCIVPLGSMGEGPHASNVEADRPWKVDLNGHYPGWYPGVDVKHMAAAYLAVAKDLPLVLRAWEVTKNKYLLRDGSVRPMTFYDNPHSVVAETTVDGSVVYYPLRLTANIDFLLLGDSIFRYAQDKAWLGENIAAMRKAAAFIEAWIDAEGLLHSDSYDLDQVYREIDGVAQASAYLAFTCLAGLESALGNEIQREAAEDIAARLKAASNTHFWDEERGYFLEHLAYNNIAKGAAVTASSELDADHAAAKVVDNITGIGIDAFGVGTGVAGRYEWAAKDETTGAWVRVTLPAPSRISQVIVYNRTDPKVQPAERFAEGTLEFSDGTSIDVIFTGLDISRAAVSFAPKQVSWVKFTGRRMQGEGGGSAGIAELMLVPADDPYRKFTHGMTDTNFAMVAFGVADDRRALRVWDHFKRHEDAFYAVGELRAPTWIAEKADTYGDSDLNKRAPHKDCVAMGRIWRYDALMRHRMGDGEGIYRTIKYANALYDRPSGGGVGLFAERYGLGRFQPGDEAQATVPGYSEYPAVYNAYIVQQALLGVDADVQGVITINPCVPSDWYDKGFGADGLGVLHGCEIGFQYAARKCKGWISAGNNARKFCVRIPKDLQPGDAVVNIDAAPAPHAAQGHLLCFEVPAGDEKRSFTITGKS